MGDGSFRILSVLSNGGNGSAHCFRYATGFVRALFFGARLFRPTHLRGCLGYQPSYSIVSAKSTAAVSPVVEIALRIRPEQHPAQRFIAEDIDSNTSEYQARVKG